MREFDEVVSRANGAKDVVVARRQIIVDDGAKLGLFVCATTIVLAKEKLLLSL